MSQAPLYPLQFEPIYQYRLWGGRRFASLLKAPLPGDGPIGEAWVLSDREDHPSRVGNGWLQGQTIGQVLEQFPERVMGKFAGRFRRFPLLLKFLDVREMLSVQVHPTDSGTAKTEAWVVLEAGIKSRIYAGPEAWRHRGDPAARAYKRYAGGPLGMLPSEARRRRF
jgi:mannose-6-phosphate isomerase